MDRQADEGGIPGGISIEEKRSEVRAQARLNGVSIQQTHHSHSLGDYDDLLCLRPIHPPKRLRNGPHRRPRRRSESRPSSGPAGTGWSSPAPRLRWPAAESRQLLGHVLDRGESQLLVLDGLAPADAARFDELIARRCVRDAGAAT